MDSSVYLSNFVTLCTCAHDTRDSPWNYVCLWQQIW